MLLFFSVFLISQISAIYSDVDEHNKYIDQLQNPDKEEFLERIARRIDGEVNLKLPVEVSANETHISDAELEKHSDYVKKIIDEEKGKFEKLDRRSFNYSHIDFTLQKKRRRKRNANSQNTEVNTEKSATIPVQTVYDKSKESDIEKHDIQVKGFKLKSRRSTNSTTNLDNLNEKAEKNVLSDKIKDKNENSENKKVTENSGLENNTTNTLITITESEKSNEQLSADANAENKTLKDETKQSDSKDNAKINLEPKLREAISVNKESEQLTLSSNKNLTVDLKDNDAEKNNKKAEELTANSNKNLTVELKDIDVEKNNEKPEELILNSNINLTVGLKHNDAGKNSKKSEELSLNSNRNLTVEPKDNNAEKKTLRTEIKKVSTDAVETPGLLDSILNNNTQLKSQLNDTLINHVYSSAVEAWNKSRKNTTETENPDRLAFILEFMDRKDVKLDGAKLLNLIDELITNYPKSVRKDTLSRLLDRMHKNYPDLKELIDKSNLTEKAVAAKNKTRKSPELSDEVKTLQIAQDVVKALRIGIDRDMMKNRNKNIRTKFGRNNVNVYGLYENSEENSRETHYHNHEKPYSHETYNNNQEQPYYVPVYSYFANNAYYNAYNKYGPNQEDTKVLKGNSKFVPLYSGDESDVSVEKLDRTFYKKPQHRKPHRNNKATARDTIFPILPPVIDSKPHNLPQYDYDYLFGKNDEFGNHFLRERKVKDSIFKDPYLKNRIRDIRLALYKYNKETDDYEKTVKDNGYKGWLDNSVEYYTYRTKTPKQMTKQIQNIDYDYLGESGDLRIEHLNSKKLLPIVKDNKAKDIINDIDKGKSDKELNTNVEEVYPLLKKLVKIVEFEEDEEVEACIRVMGDLIQTDNEGLEHYDWLESTVNVQSAIEKLLDLTVAAITREAIHPSDLELLKYTTYLHSLSVTAKEEPSGRRSTLPKSRNKKANRNVKTGYKERVWLYRIPDPGVGYDFDYEALQKFLNDLADNLYDLHNAVKHISMITTLRNQHWFNNLKDLYLRKPKRKQLLELVLHLGTTRLFNLIEDSSKKGIEKNFLKYIHENQLEVAGIQEAFVFVLKVLDSAIDNKLIENY